MTKPLAYVLAELRREIDRAGTAAALAQEYKVSESEISSALNGKRTPSARLLLAMGFRRVQMYETVHI